MALWPRHSPPAQVSWGLKQGPLWLLSSPVAPVLLGTPRPEGHHRLDIHLTFIYQL